MKKTCLNCGKVFEGDDSVLISALIIYHNCEEKEERK